jgi:hypothetical protein
MKKLAGLGLVLVLLALASPVLAGPVLRPYCWNVEGTSCPTLGQTRSCTDACGYNYTCTCISWGGQRVWDCPEVC